MLVTSLPIDAIRDLVMKSFVLPQQRTGGDEKNLFIPRDPKGGMGTQLERIVEMDRERYRATRKLPGQNSAQAGIAQGYYKDIQRYTYSITRKIAGEDVEALQDHELANWAMDVRSDIEDIILLNMRNFLGYGASGASSYTDNGGFTVDLTTGDGVSVFNASHTLKNSATSYSNILSGAPSLSESSLDTGMDFFTYNRLDNYGKPLASPGKLTIITTNKAVMVNRVKRILGSMSPSAIEGTGNSNSGVVNVNQNRYNHLMIDFDQDANGNWNSTYSFYWFIAALEGPEDARLQWYYVRWKSPYAAPVEVKQDPWVISLTARALCGLGALSAKGICVSKATS